MRAQMSGISGHDVAMSKKQDDWVGLINLCCRLPNSFLLKEAKIPDKKLTVMCDKQSLYNGVYAYLMGLSLYAILF